MAALLASGLQLHAQSTTGIYVNSNNNVGIGTISPDLKFQVNVGTAATYGLGVYNTNDNLKLLFGTTTGSYLNIQGKTIGTNAPYNITLEAEGGNVGIGTTGPAVTLHVKTNTGVRIEEGGGSRQLVFEPPDMNNSSNNAKIYTNGTALGIDLGINGTPKLTLNTNGNVGIGTTSPSYALDVTSTNPWQSRAYIHPANGSEYALLQFCNSGGTTYFGMDNSNGTGLGSGTPYALTMYAATVPIVLSSGGGERMRITTSGNVGIGTTSPNAKLDVEGGGIMSNQTIFVNGYTVNSGSTSLILNNGYSGGAGNVGETYALTAGIPDTNEGGFSINKLSNYTYGAAVQFISTPILSYYGGNLGIGTNWPQYALDVNGDVHANSYWSNTGSYADFVFKPGYKLPSLNEEETAIKKDGHLPGIPSEKEAKTHGINLADMQVKLLQKIEELTLHQIEQEKHQIEQGKILSAQESKLSDQAQRIENLEKENAELREKLAK